MKLAYKVADDETCFLLVLCQRADWDVVSCQFGLNYSQRWSKFDRVSASTAEPLKLLNRVTEVLRSEPCLGYKKLMLLVLLQLWRSVHCVLRQSGTNQR